MNLRWRVESTLQDTEITKYKVGRISDGELKDITPKGTKRWGLIRNLRWRVESLWKYNSVAWR